MPKYCYRCMEKMNEEDSTCGNCGRTLDQNVAPHLLRPGTIINNKFLVGDVIGEGGFGITYIGRDLNLDMKIAIKEYFPSGFVNRNNNVSAQVSKSATKEREEFFDNGCKRFLDEARNLAMLAGEQGVVTVRDFFQENNTAYIIMEYIEGKTLKTFIEENGTIDGTSAAKMVRPIIESLIKVHENGLVHRDISPDNIMITNNKQVKLLDFGAARNISAINNKSISIILKHGYAPEEQYRSRGQQGPWTDIYAICATLYKCITGVTPDSANERLASDEVKYPSALGIDIYPELEQVIMKGMSVNAVDRYQTMAELLDAVQIALGEKNASDIEIIHGAKTKTEEMETVRIPKTEDHEAEDRQRQLAEEERQKQLAEEERQRQLAEEERQRQLAEEERQRQLAEEERQKQLADKKKKEKAKPEKKSGKMLRNIGIAVALIVVAVVAVILLTPIGSTSSGTNTSKASNTAVREQISDEQLAQAKEEIVFKNKNSIEMVNPKNPLTAEQVKALINDTDIDEGYFYGKHMIAGCDINDTNSKNKAIEEFSKQVGFGTRKNSSGRYYTNLPYEITAGDKSFGTSRPLKESKEDCMTLNFYGEDGGTVRIVAVYEVDDDTKTINFIPVISKIENGVTKEYADEDNQFQYSFELKAGNGGTIVLKDGDKSVELIASGFGENSSYSFYNIALDIEHPELKDQGFDKMTLRYFRSNDEIISVFRTVVDGKTLNDGIGSYSKDGVLTAYFTDGHKENTKYYSMQFIVFSCYRDGLILIDENGEEYYCMNN